MQPNLVMMYLRKLFSVVGALAVLLCCILLFRLFSFEYFDRATEEGGIGLSLLPRWGAQRFDLEFWGVLWLPGHDEWGGEPVFFREQLVGAWFNVLAILLALEVLVRFRPRWELGARSTVLLLAAGVGFAGYFVEYAADYASRVFALHVCWPCEFETFSAGDAGTRSGLWCKSEGCVLLAKLADDFAAQALAVAIATLVLGARGLVARRLCSVAQVSPHGQ